MRLLTEFKDKELAEKFVAHLIQQGLDTFVDEDKQERKFLVWIREEDQVPIAKQELGAFWANPNDDRYLSARKKHQTRTSKSEQPGPELANQVAMQRARQLAARPPITIALCVLCALISILAGFDDKVESNVEDTLKFVSLSDYETSEQDALANIREGEIWRLLTPIFLHGSVIHLALNLFMLFQLGRIVELIEGSWRYGLFVLLMALTANVLQALTPPGVDFLPKISLGGINFVGISGVVFGLFGFYWIKISRRPDLGPPINPANIALIGAYLVFGFVAGDSLQLANMSHLGGLVAGIVLGFLAAGFDPPYMKETQDSVAS